MATQLNISPILPKAVYWLADKMIAASNWSHALADFQSDSASVYMLMAFVYVCFFGNISY
jgi:hypothetical protein